MFHLDFWDQYFTFDNGKAQNLKIIDKHNIQNNFLQVINQYYSQGDYKNCYDVSIL
ncbi:type I restriction endonuclease [Helicobacter muridarum]|uniref:type I restriction endonuclease n=1 Tax=Helicobacter muridarum TaxID=216 RepID=UPI0038B4030D